MRHFEGWSFVAFQAFEYFLYFMRIGDKLQPLSSHDRNLDTSKDRLHIPLLSTAPELRRDALFDIVSISGSSVCSGIFWGTGV